MSCEKIRRSKVEIKFEFTCIKSNKGEPVTLTFRQTSMRAVGYFKKKEQVSDDEKRISSAQSFPQY